MIKMRGQQGFAASILLAGVFFVLFIAVAGFGYWAFSGRQDYKNNVDKKINEAVASSEESQKAKLEADFFEKEKSPNKVYKGPLSLGTVTFNYPKTWSAYVDESNSSAPLNGFFHPDVVPGVQSSTAFAIRMELTTRDYSSTLKEFDNQVKQGKVTAKAYVPPKMVNISNVSTGTRLDGAISKDNQGKDKIGSMLIIKVRDKTLKLYTESTAFSSDYENIILATLTYIP